MTLTSRHTIEVVKYRHVGKIDILDQWELKSLKQIFLYLILRVNYSKIPHNGIYYIQFKRTLYHVMFIFTRYLLTYILDFKKWIRLGTSLLKTTVEFYDRPQSHGCDTISVVLRIYSTPLSHYFTSVLRG